MDRFWKQNTCCIKIEPGDADVFFDGAGVYWDYLNSWHPVSGKYSDRNALFVARLAGLISFASNPGKH